MAPCAVVGFPLDADVHHMERAKVMLMQTQHLPDDASFQMLRTASMDTNHRPVQVSQHLMKSAGLAQDVNRWG